MKRALKVIKYLPKFHKYWKHYVKNYTFDEEDDPIKITLCCKEPNIEIEFNPLGIKVRDDNDFNRYISIEFKDDDNFFDSSFFNEDKCIEFVKGNGLCFRISPNSGDYFIYENKKFFDKDNEEVDLESQCFQYNTLYDDCLQYNEIVEQCKIFDTLHEAMKENSVEYLWMDVEYDILDKTMKLLKGWGK